MKELDEPWVHRCVQCRKEVKRFAVGGIWGVGWCYACYRLSEKKQTAYVRAWLQHGRPDDFPETYDRAFAQGGIPKELEVHTLCR